VPLFVPWPRAVVFSSYVDNARNIRPDATGRATGTPPLRTQVLYEIDILIHLVSVRATFSHIPERVGMHSVIDLIMIRLSGTDLPMFSWQERVRRGCLLQTTIMDLGRNSHRMNPISLLFARW
jgi:hypothetical protein